MIQTVLFVDDDSSLTAAVQRTLRHESYRVLTCLSGEAALEIIAHESIDILVSDEQMPGMGGLELLTTVHRLHPSIVNIMLSGNASIGTVVRALSQGQIFRFLIKPCTSEELVQTLRQALMHKLMLDRCCLLLPIFRRQAAIIRAIEQQSPGMIAAIEARLTAPPASLKDIDYATVESVSELIDVEIRQVNSPAV